MMPKSIFISILFGFTLMSVAQGLAETKMNEMTADQFGDFKANFNFVTVRYRKDSGEIRFVYANDIAWKALKNSETNYPDGAVFAKVGIASEEDPAFPSSAVPSGKRRIQFMLKDKNKYMNDQGWGYALFDWTGNTFPGDLKEVTQGCIGCHQIAKDRGFVFSQIIGDQFVKKVEFDAWKNTNKFKSIKLSELPKRIQKYLSSKIKTVNSLYGGLSESSFYGTLDEVRPLLSKKVFESKMPAILLSKDEKQFSLVFLDAKKICSKGEVALSSVHSTAGKDSPDLESNFCFQISN